MALSHQLSLSPKRLVWHLSCSFRKTASKLYYPSRRDSKNGGIDGSDALPVLPRGLRGSRVTCQGIGCHKPHSTLTSNFPFSLRTTPFTAHMKHCLLQSQPLLMTAHPYQVLLPSPESGVSVRARSPEERLRAKVRSPSRWAAWPAPALGRMGWMEPSEAYWLLSHREHIWPQGQQVHVPSHVLSPLWPCQHYTSSQSPCFLGQIKMNGRSESSLLCDH